MVKTLKPPRRFTLSIWLKEKRELERWRPPKNATRADKGLSVFRNMPIRSLTLTLETTAKRKQDYLWTCPYCSLRIEAPTARSGYARRYAHLKARHQPASWRKSLDRWWREAAGLLIGGRAGMERWGVQILQPLVLGSLPRFGIARWFPGVAEHWRDRGFANLACILLAKFTGPRGQCSRTGRKQCNWQGPIIKAYHTLRLHNLIHKNHVGPLHLYSHASHANILQLKTLAIISSIWEMDLGKAFRTTGTAATGLGIYYWYILRSYFKRSGGRRPSIFEKVFVVPALVEGRFAVVSFHPSCERHAIGMSRYIAAKKAEESVIIFIIR